MNYRDKIQKFSIRKYTVGTFSTVIATLVFLGLNTSQAQAAETNQPASALKQKQQNGDTQTENREVEVQNSQNGQSLSAPIENEQPNNNQTNHVDASAVQSSTTEHDQPVSQNEQAKKDTAAATPTQSAKAASKHEQSESRAANKKENDNEATHVESHEANVVTASDSSDSGNVQHDRNELQAFFDANYHDYRFIDRENADSGTFNYVKGIFDKINTLLGSNDPINNKDLQLAYKELEQAVALIRTMPQRQQTSRRSSRIQTRSIESRAAEPRSVSDYQNANSSYYVENANDGSGYPVGTYINASSKGAPYNLPTTPWNTLKASDAKEFALITAKQTGDGYQWVIKFNKGHAPHENMIFWFALPDGQTPVGRTEFVTVNADGTNVQWSNGAGAGANKPLPQMWEYGVNDPHRSHDFKIRNRSGQVIYEWPTVHIKSLSDLARASDYLNEAGATPATKAFGRQIFDYINGQKPAESSGVPKVYTFIGQGDASYTISFKTQGPTIDKLYYAAGARALEYNQLFMYSQLYVESTQDQQQRLNGLRQVVNRTYRIGTTKRVEVSQGNVQTKKVLESTNLNIDDFVDDPLSYVKTPSNKVLGFYPTNANTNAFRQGGVNPLNDYQLSQLFSDQNFQEAARTKNPIRLMIGFDYPDAFGNGETLVPVNLTVLPEIQHNIKFFKNDDGQNIAEKPASKQAGHPVFYVYAGNQGNASVNLGGSVTSIQPLRINLTSNENFTDKDWQITGIPRTLHIENSTNRPNNARERNIELVGNLLPGDYFGTIRFGRKEQLFEIRVKPHTPRITTTAEELRGTALQKVPVTVTDIPLDPSALVYLVIPTSQTKDGGSEADQIPSGYTKIATGTPDGVHSTITIRPEDYVVFIPPVGHQIRALIFYNNVVASNMSNAVTILPDDIPPTINNPVGLNAKYYRGDEVSFTMGVSDRHSGLKSTTITTLPSGWTSNLTKSDKKNGSLAISGRVSMNQAYNSDITFKVSATDNVNNTTNDSQSKHVTVHVGKISDDAHPIVLGNSEKVVVVNPTALTGDEKQRITTAFMNKNQNIRGYLASSNPVTVDNHGNVTLQYRDGSSTTLDATNVMTYEPVVKPEYQTANAPKTATVTIAKGQSFNIGDIKQYFTLSNGQAIPSSTFTNITSDRTIPTAQEVSQMNAGTQLYHITATNAYHKDTEDFYITLKIIDVKQPEGDQRVYRMSTYDITTDEISKVKQAFINANRDAISFAEGDISVTNTPNGSNVSTITVNINKGRLTKSFTSNLANMNFLRWVNFPQDYTVTWTNAKIANRPTDGGLSWSDDHKSLIYRYDATLGTQITTNDILTLLKATTTVPGLRNNIAGNEKAQAEAGGRPNYKTTGYSQSNPTSDGQRQFTLNGQVIQIMDIINPSNGFGGQPVTNSNVRANHSNSTVVSVNESAANGAGAFTIDHVVKNNSTHNAADAVYKAQLYLSPYGPKQYVEHLNQNTGNTTDAINIYFVPSDLVNPTVSVGNYTNHQVFSGETFTNTITANDNFGVQSVTVPNTSQLTGTVDNNHQHVSATAPNVTSATNKTINLVATDTSGNTATTSFNVTIKPLRDKYRVGTSSTAANPVRIANISNNATVSQADQTAIINSLTFTSNAPNRNYATASASEITSKTVSNVSRTGNNAQVTVTVTYQDGTTSTVTVPVKHVIPEIVAHSHYTVQGQDFPTGNGASASDYFKLSNGSAIPDATITWVSGQAPNKNNTTIGQDINVTAHILIDGETTPITKTATYKVVSSVPKHVFETNRGAVFPGISDVYDAKQYVKPVNDSWTQNAQRMNFQFTNSYGPSKDVVGISTRDIRVTYDNHQTQIIKILAKVKPDPPRIDGNSVTYKAGLTNQQIKINNVLSSSSIKLFKADNTPLTITNTTYGSGNTAVVTVSDALPNGVIKARSSITMNNVTYTTQDEHGRAIDVTRNESVDSNDSATVTVTPQLQATTEGAVFIKGGDGFDFGHVERFIQNPPHGATVAWHDSPDTWKNTVGNTHKTAVVTLPSGQGTRNVEVPVKVYPVANAKAPSRDVKGQNLTNGTDAINYITFDPNTNTNGITAAWANRQQPNNQQAGVQHLNVDVTYPGISAAKRVPVTVNVYQFEFPQTSYTTTVGGTLASGTQASGYAHIQNANGLPTDGFTYKWNRDTTGTNDANWAAMNKPNAAKVINAKYDVIYNGHTFATSLLAKFVVKDVQPAKPTVTETAAGAITIAPGANQTVNTHAGNVTTYADKLVIKRNGNVVTTFTRHNNTSPWVKEASAATVAGIVGTNNGITVAAGTFNAADTIQVVATQGSGETISDEQLSDDFTVVAPQPNQATTKIWQNGHIDIMPNNPSGHLINPTQAMDIAYTEKVGNGAEHSKTLNAVRGQNNQWTIANKPDYVTLDAHTGKVTFNANTIKPNSAITITPKAGTGHSASSNPSTLTAPATHTVNTTEIVKDYGSNVTPAEINNAVQVANKRTATIKNGTAMPTNLAGGSTTTIPVTVTYNDSSTEEVQESIFTKADKRELIIDKNHLDDPVSTDGKKPGTITQYNNAIHNAQQQINAAKTEAQQVINNERATPQQVSDALTKVRAAQTKIDQAKALLQNKEDNSQLVTSKNNLQSSVNQVPSTTGMTQQSIDNYNAKKRDAESEITAAQRVIDNGDATAQQISDEKRRVDNALTALNQAKHDLTADTHALEQAVQQLNRTGITTGKKPASITAYNNSIRALQSDLTSAKNSANAIIQKPIRSVQEVQTALTNVNRVNERLTQAINQLVPLADNSALRTAKTKLDEEINKSVTTDGMTQSSIQAYENAKRAGQTESTNAQNVINNGDATDQQIAAEKTKVEEKYNSLKQAIDGLTPDLAPLQTAKTQFQNDIDQPTNTTGMTSASVATFNEKLSAARTKIQEIDRVLASHPDVATIRQNVTAANAAKSALDQARNGLTVDKAPLENAKNQLQHSIDTQTSTTGMTQDSINAYNAKLTAARNKVQQINQVLAGSPTVDQINTNTSAANQAKSDLDHARQALTPDKAPLQNAKTQLEQSINQPTDTTGMTTASLNAYNQKLQAARQKLTEINQVLNGNPTVQKINDKVTEANQAKDQLNTARQGLTLDRQPALSTLHGASNLNQAQQNNFTQQINAAQNHAALETIKSNITALNNAMTKLKESVADNNSIKSGQNYTDATQANKQAYDNAVNAAKGVIGETNNPTMDVNTVNQKASSVKSTQDALDGQQNLQRAKTEATNAITHASDLNQAQKNALTQQVNSAQNVQAVNDIKQTTQSLNTAMTGLKRGVANHNQVVQSDNYVNADTNKKNDYNNAYNHANDIINGNAQHPVITPSDVNNALSNVTNKEHALNGEAKLNAAKQEANTALGHLNNLNNAQRQNLQSQINGAHQIETVNTIKQNATNLNSAMGNLRQAVADKDQVKRTEDYADADTAKQNAYNSAVSSAETIINQTTNPTLNPDDITRVLTQVTDAKNGLNGEAKLATEKQNAKDAVNAMTHLNDAQKQALNGQIDQSPEIATVTQVKQTATSLDQAMNQLSQAINDKTQTLADGNYLNADPDKQNAYKQAVAKAEALLNKQSGTNEVQAQVESITNEVNAAKQALNGNDNLANAKQQAKQQLANLTHLNDAQKQSFESQITQAPLVTDVTTINQKAQALDHAMELLRNSIADNQATLASEDYHDAAAQRQNDYNQAVTAANNIINQTTSPTMNPDDVNRATTQVNNTKVALDGDENLAAAKQQANNRLDQLDHLNNAQKQQLQSQITQSSDIAAVNGHKQTAESLNTAMGNLINAIADHQAVEQRGNFINADTDKQTAYTTAVNEAEAMINKQTGQNANQTEVEQAITKVQTTLQALNGDHNLQVAKTNATQAIDALTSLNDPQKTALKDQVTAATLVTAVHQIEQNANTLNQAMHGLRESIQDNAATKANSKYINEDQPEQQNYDQAVQAANNIINEQTATLDNNVINQAATTVNTTKAALHGDVKLQNDKDHAKQAVSQLAHLNNAQKHMEDTLIDSETTRTAVNHDLTEAQALDQLMDALQQSIADKDATRASSAYVNAEPNKKQAYDEAVQNAESIIAGLNNPTINKGNVTSATQAVTSSKNALDGVERLAQDKQTAGNSLNHLDQLTPAQQQALENQINNATTRDKVAEIIAQAQALNEAMKALKESIKDQPQTEASSKFINEDQAQKDAYTQAVQHAKDLINKTTDPTLVKSVIDQATQAVNDAKNNLHGDQKLAQDKQRATETLNNLSNLNTPQRQALENQINNAATRGEVAQKLTEAQALNQAMEALRNSIQDQQQTEAGSKFINEDKPQKDAYQAAVQHAKDLINQTSNPTLDKAQVEQLTQAVNQAKDNLHGDQKLADDKQHAVTDLNQLNGLNNPQRQALESQINNAATRDEVAQKLAEAKALNQAMEALRNSIQDQQQTESGSKFINEDKPQKDAYQAAVQHAKDLINQTGNPTLDKSQVEQLTQAVATAKDNLHGDQKLVRDQQQAVTTVNALPNLNHAQQQAVTTVNALPNLNHAQQQALTDAINAAPTRTEVAQHVQTATELDHAMETLKNKVDQVNTDKAQPNYTEASTDKKDAVDQALQAAQSITDPTNGSNANKYAVEQALTKLQGKENELNGNERVAEAKTQAKQTIDQLTHLNADQIATAKQNIDQATKLQPIAELVDQATQLNQSMDQLQQAVNEHANVEQTVDYTQADLDKQNAYKQAIAEAENVLKQNANKQQVDQALQNILNAKQALNGDERVALAKTNGKHDIDQLNALNNAQQDGFKGRIDQSNDLNQIQQIVDEAKALNRAMNQLSQEITGNEGRTKGSTNYVNADTQVKRVYDEAVDKAKEALNKATGQNLTAEEVIKLNDAVTAAKQALNGEERLNNRKSEALQRLDQLTHLNNAQRQLAIQQINNAETLNKASRAINRAVQLDDAMGAVQQYIDEHHLDVISSTNYINADDNLKANYDNAITNAAHELDKVQGSAIAKAEAEQLKQHIIDAQKALNGDQNLATAKDKANAFVDTLNGLNQQQQDLAHQAINNADTVTGIANIINDQIDLNNAMETLKHLVDNEIPTAEQTVNYQNADDVAKSNFDDAKRLANALINSDNTNVNDINGAIQAVKDVIQNLNGEQRLQEAKDKAIQNVNKVLADKLKEIEASNATDQDKLIAKNKAEELANSIINNINKATSNQDVSRVQTAGNQAIEQVHANEIPKAKIDANKDVDKQVQALIDEIDRNPNLTDKEKQALKDRINQILQQGHNGINNAMTKEEIEHAKAQLAQALQDIKDLVKAKENAKQDVDKQVQALIDEIDRNPNLTDKEKQALKDRINQILQQGHNGINNAMTKEEIEHAKAQLAQALQDIKDLVKAKENAKQDVDKQVQALIDEIDRNPNLTDKEKQALKDRINQILQQGHNGINNAMTKEEIEQAKAQLAQALQDIKDLVKAKEDAKNAIKALANEKRDQINSNPDLTPEQKAKALKEIDEAEKRALENIENAQTKDQLNKGLNLGLDDIRNTHVWEVDAQPAVNEIFDATPEQILVNGELIVHRDDIITEQDIHAHINLIDQLTAEIIDTPSTATISDSLTAKVEVTLLDGSKVIVSVPVKVVEKELTVVKQQAIESIENAAQQKINEINNHATLTPEQKEAAIAEVNKLKQQAIEQINNAADVHTVEEVQHQEQAHIEQFNPDQFTIDQAKSNAIKSISDAIQHMIDEINASKDLTDKEKQEAISKLNQLKDQSIQAIQRAQSIDEIAQQLEQFKAQLKAANPFAKELENRKKSAISKIKDISTDEINRIRNSTIGTAEERQAAMNRINEIVLETIRDINNAHTPQQVEAALNNGIARILAVQIVTSDHSKPSSNSDGQSNSHLHVGYGTVNHPYNSTTIGHKKKLDQDDEIDPLHMRHFGDRIGNVIKNALGVVGISGLLASFWFFIAKRRRKEDEEEELEIRDNSKDKKKGSVEGTKHLPLLFAKRRRKEDEEDAIVEEKDSLNNDESLDKVKHTPFFLPKRRRKEDEEDVEVTNENTDEKVLQDNEHSPILIAKRRRDKEEDVETTSSIDSKDEDVPVLLAKKKNQKDNQSKGKKSASKKPSKKVAAKKKKKKSKKIKNNLFLR
ncbi:TPA: hyperosmolarity resistance protein Ebh [Staphylococcus aureus]|nr:hyperosmolarity resistance protein Ebh [Staphylococcus aureus]